MPPTKRLLPTAAALAARATQIQRPGTMSSMVGTAAPLSSSTGPATPPGSSAGTDRSTDTFTYITRPLSGNQPTPILYNGDREWARVTLVLETAGPVVVGTRAELAPVLSGSGRLLQTNIPFTITIAKGTRLYILATAVNRVGVTIEPEPWLETIKNDVATIAGK